MLPNSEWAVPSLVATHEPMSLLGQRGWSVYDIIVFDLETCEGAAFNPTGLASADLMKHRIWVCPMFEPFLKWLYKELKSMDPAGWSTWFDNSPKLVELPDAPFDMQGYRRPGPKRQRKEA